MTRPLSYLEIEGEALRHNVRAIASLLRPGIKVAAVVKGNAYGHGQQEVTQALMDSVDYFQLDDIEELRVLRQTSQKPCLVLGYIQTADLEEALTLGCELAVYDFERLDALDAIARRLGKRATVHAKVDAYLGRQGLLLEDIERFGKEIRLRGHIHLKAAYSHFANIEDTPDFAHAQRQIDCYQQALEVLKGCGFEALGTHLSSTSGVLAYETFYGVNSLARVGIGAYGLYPSEQLAASYAHLHLRPALRWVSHVAQVKTLPAGFPVGYGLTYVTDRETRVAIVPQGYSDGYDRGLSSKGVVLINGHRCPVIGRIAMNMFAADVTCVPHVKPEDEAVLLGAQGEERITAEEIAAKIDTINYEVTTRISPLLPRTLV